MGEIFMAAPNPEDVEEQIRKITKQKTKPSNNKMIEPLKIVFDENGMESICTNMNLMWDKINEIIDYVNQLN